MTKSKKTLRQKEIEKSTKENVIKNYREQIEEIDTRNILSDVKKKLKSETKQKVTEKLNIKKARLYQVIENFNKSSKKHSRDESVHSGKFKIAGGKRIASEELVPAEKKRVLDKLSTGVLTDITNVEQKNFCEQIEEIDTRNILSDEKKKLKSEAKQKVADKHNIKKTQLYQAIENFNKSSEEHSRDSKKHSRSPSKVNTSRKKAANTADMDAVEPLVSGGDSTMEMKGGAGDIMPLIELYQINKTLNRKDLMMSSLISILVAGGKEEDLIKFGITKYYITQAKRLYNALYTLDEGNTVIMDPTPKKHRKRTPDILLEELIDIILLPEHSHPSEANKVNCNNGTIVILTVTPIQIWEAYSKLHNQASIHSLFNY